MRGDHVRTCDRLVDVDCAVGEVPCLVPVDSGNFIVDEAGVTYWGICPACQTHQSTIPRTSKEQ